LVDDETIERLVLKKFLSKMDAVTVIGEADSGTRALERFRELDPDIVIMDVKMPGLDGIEASKKIKQIKSDCVIIFLTAYLEAGKIHEFMLSGGEAWLQKPVRESELINTINRFKVSARKEQETPDYGKILTEKIITKNYKGAKGALNDLLKYQMPETDSHSSLVDAKAAYQDIAAGIIGTLDQLDVKYKRNSIKENELMNEIRPINDVYLLRTWIFKVLDYVFNVIVLGQKGFQDNEINVVLNYLEKNYYKKVTLEEVAEYINISPFYLSKIFKKHTGVNFIDYLTNLKIEKAKELLEYTDMPVINIAIELSFNEPNYFARVFRKTVGMTPSKYREAKRQTSAGVSRLNEVKWYV
jgi:two-component system response regulator YesN